MISGTSGSHDLMTLFPTRRRMRRRLRRHSTPPAPLLLPPQDHPQNPQHELDLLVQQFDPPPSPETLSRLEAILAAAVDEPASDSDQRGQS